MNGEDGRMAALNGEKDLSQLVICHWYLLDILPKEGAIPPKVEVRTPPPLNSESRRTQDYSGSFAVIFSTGITGIGGIGSYNG